MLMSVQGVQTGAGSTVISWVVDDDNSVVKYCHNNIVTIYVPGDSENGGDNENDDEADDIPGLAIVAHNTLRLRIVPCDPDHLGTPQIKYLKDNSDIKYELMVGRCWIFVREFPSGNNYQEILDDDHYDYCRDDVITPPPLPPRKHHSQSPLICQTFPRRRKNLFHHLGVKPETDSALTKNHQDIFVIQKTSSNAARQLHRKDLEKFLGVAHLTLSKSSSNKKDLSSFLGVNRSQLERVMRGSRKMSGESGEGSGSTDSSSVWSS